jgi:phosphoribosylformylglycinamidine cyclo-ligase
MTYKAAGVDINVGNDFVRAIRPLVRSTRRPEVIGDIGGFGGLFAFDAKKYRAPVLVSGTDGVGTKLKVAQRVGRHDTVGVDLVAMCVNDVVVCGAEPLFFLDYLATGKIDPSVSVEIVRGIADGCRQAGCALIGGETAEMPSFYTDGEYDLAGFAVGVVDRARIIDGSNIADGDRVIGVASSGLHSNGFSLARKALLESAGLDLAARVAPLQVPLGEELLRPTRIYVKTVLALAAELPVKGVAHITGGGITENLPRVVPDGLQVRIDPTRWIPPPIFGLIQAHGNVAPDEMFRVFNMGVGLAIIVAPDAVDAALHRLIDLGERASVIGEIGAGPHGVVYV